MPDHIKIPDITPVVRYLANGVETVFIYPFPIFASEDLQVSLNGAQQISGFTIEGAGETEGGSVVFDSAPEDDSVVTLQRVLPIERVSDYLEGGDFSAASINTELDYLVASVQQVERENNLALRYSDNEEPANNELPSRKARRNKVLGFDGDGNPTALPTSSAQAFPEFIAQGVGAEMRSGNDKFSDTISVKDFGALGDGLSDDTIAIQNALAASQNVFVPEGVYLVSSTIALGSHQRLYGSGSASVLRCQSKNFDAVQMRGGFSHLSHLKIENAGRGVLLSGFDAACVCNTLTDLSLVSCDVSLVLDGGEDKSQPCESNNFTRIQIEEPFINGVHLTLSGNGDAPKANKFHMVTVNSLSALTSGSGFYVEYGGINNSFVDCEAHVNGQSAQSCFRLGGGCNKALLINLLCVSDNLVPNVLIDAGAVETAIMNLSALSDGAAILDNSGGNYDALNAGFPEVNRMRRTVVTDLRSTLQRYDTEFIDVPGTHDLDLSHSVHIVNATNGEINIRLPAAGDAVGVAMTIKKADLTGNIITISEQGSGLGPDRRMIQLGGPNDYANVISNGAQWFITSSNRISGNTRFADTSGLFDIDLSVDTYILSSFGGALTARLPPANAPEAIGRSVTIKKTDPSSNPITITEQGGAGPDQSHQILSARYQAITVLSDGGQWFIVSRF